MAVARCADAEGWRWHGASTTPRRRSDNRAKGAPRARATRAEARIAVRRAEEGIGHEEAVSGVAQASGEGRPAPGEGGEEGGPEVAPRAGELAARCPESQAVDR